MTIAIVATNGFSLSNFRGKLIRDWVNKGYEVVCISIEPVEEMRTAIEVLGATYYQVEGSRVGIGLMSGIRMIKNYVKAFKEIKPDYCFLYMSKPVAFGCPAAVIAKVKHINVLINGLENAYYRNTFKDFIVRQVMSLGYWISSKYADNVFVQNNDDAQLLISKKIVSERKIKVLNGSGVDMTYFGRTPLPDKPVFLMVARLLWSKGIKEYLSAIMIVKHKYPDAEFMLVGGLDNNDESLSREELDLCISKHKIEYCGHASDVRPFIDRSSIFVLPSYHEGTPRSVLEAMAKGRAIITTLAPGCRETVIDGENGYLVPVGNTEILADRMCALIEDYSLCKKMGDRSYEICCNKFDVNLVNSEINALMF